MTQMRFSKFQNSMRNMKKDKALGPDKVEGQTLIMLAPSLIKLMTALFKKTLETENIPEQRKLSEIILLFKKGERKLIENYRPISITSNINKVFMKIIKNRMYNQLDNN